jgi:hypothetical protein
MLSFAFLGRDLINDKMSLVRGGFLKNTPTHFEIPPNAPQKSY